MMHAWVVVAGLALTQPVVLDGDTLRDGDERYRVENIDAPERGARARCLEERALAEAASAYVAARPSPGAAGALISAAALGYSQPLDEASAATSLVGRAIRPFCVMRTS